MAQVYTTQEVADLLDVHKNTIFYWLKTNKVREPQRDVFGKTRIWAEADVEALRKLKKADVPSEKKVLKKVSPSKKKEPKLVQGTLE